MLSLAARIELEKDKIVRIIGPAHVNIEEGCIRILGINFCKGSNVLIHRYRSYAIKAVENAVMSITLGEGGSIEEPAEGEEVIDVWEQITKEILDEGESVVIIGPVDSGKTSFSLLISNISLDRGMKPALIDADIGQGDLAPPGFIAMKIMDRKVLWLREIRGEVLRLIGAITPTVAFAAIRLLAAISELVSKARMYGAKPIIINTDGWTSGILALEFKLNMIKTVKPSHVVVLDEDICIKIKNSLKGSSVKVLCAPRPKIVRERDRLDRKYLRRQHYQMYFTNAKKVCVDLDKISILGSCLFSGSFESPLNERIADIIKESSAIASCHDDAIIVLLEKSNAEIVTKIREAFPDKELYIIHKDNVKGLLAAILDKNLEEKAPAIIEDIDIINRRICLLTEYSNDINGIYIGRIRLTDEWEEISRYVKCPL
ncbi:MAG TPA: hypothetical protein ENF93_02055 [Ignisphaera sp.]|nr:hypothetical protein [Ignisphaera sp.]